MLWTLEDGGIVKTMGLVFNIKKMFTYFVLLIIGLSLMAYGVLSYFQDQQIFHSMLSDDEIIERAKGLGMVELKDQINNQIQEQLKDESKND
ncbi:hypothetical protein QE109_16805 [Fusibacter bizertensis]|jgi:hypothetical protein|uniref:Uncharacterized protein n=1 Tax=Fusibacter bizertensis TaxID=1488331 RepID=A0ABT6NHB5_9FIRM|nr:hypothetical protein [Fusibacter bizertensis]MDH8679821.1 hypothetical protein [Fusibacter bizertensis]